MLLPICIPESLLEQLLLSRSSMAKCLFNTLIKNHFFFPEAIEKLNQRRYREPAIGSQLKVMSSQISWRYISPPPRIIETFNYSRIIDLRDRYMRAHSPVNCINQQIQQLFMKEFSRTLWALQPLLLSRLALKTPN